MISKKKDKDEITIESKREFGQLGQTSYRQKEDGTNINTDRTNNVQPTT